MKWPDNLTELAQWGMAAATAVGIALGLRRKQSKVKLDSTEDDVKSDWIQQQHRLLREERERNEVDRKLDRQALRESTQALEKSNEENALLRADVKSLTAQLRRANAENARWRRMLVKLQPNLAEVLRSDFGELGDPELDLREPGSS